MTNSKKSIATSVLTLVFAAAGMVLVNAAEANISDESAKSLLSMMVPQEQSAYLESVLAAPSLDELDPAQRAALEQITTVARQSIGGGRENFP